MYDRNMSTQYIATYVRCDGCQLWANNPQNVATGWPNAHNMLHVHSTMLRSFGRGFIIIGVAKQRKSKLFRFREKFSQNFAVNSPPKNKRRFAISHEQNNSFRLNLTSCKYKHRCYEHHSNFRTANFYIKIFWKRTWPPTVEEFRMISRRISRMTWLVRHSKL